MQGQLPCSCVSPLIVPLLLFDPRYQPPEGNEHYLHPAASFVYVEKNATCEQKHSCFIVKPLTANLSGDEMMRDDGTCR